MYTYQYINTLAIHTGRQTNYLPHIRLYFLKARRTHSACGLVVVAYKMQVDSADAICTASPLLC